MNFRQDKKGDAKFTRSFCFLAMFLFIFSCGKDDPIPITITLSGTNFQLDEHPGENEIVGSISVETSRGEVSLEIVSQSHEGAFSLDGSNIIVSNPKYFDFELGMEYSLEIEAVNENVTQVASFTVELNDISDDPVTIWTGATTEFTKEAEADWTLEGNQDKLTTKTVITRQDSGPIYNYQWWQDEFGEDATHCGWDCDLAGDLMADFWDEMEETLRDFTPTGGTKNIRWAILDNSGDENNLWPEDFALYGVLGDPINYYSFHNIGSFMRYLDRGDTPVEVTDEFTISLTGAESGYTSTDLGALVGHNLGAWLVDENIYLKVKFTKWDNGNDDPGGSFSYERSTPEF